MNDTQLIQLAEETFGGALDVMKRKNADYTAGMKEYDALLNFKLIASLLNISPYKVWGVYAMKHMLAILKFTNTGRVESEGLFGRVDDQMNYAILLKALATDEKNGVRMTIDLEEYFRIHMAENGVQNDDIIDDDEPEIDQEFIQTRLNTTLEALKESLQRSDSIPVDVKKMIEKKIQSMEEMVTTPSTSDVEGVKVVPPPEEDTLVIVPISDTLEALLKRYQMDKESVEKTIIPNIISMFERFQQKFGDGRKCMTRVETFKKPNNLEKKVRYSAYVVLYLKQDEHPSGVQIDRMGFGVYDSIQDVTVAGEMVSIALERVHKKCKIDIEVAEAVQF